MRSILLENWSSPDEQFSFIIFVFAITFLFCSSKVAAPPLRLSVSVLGSTSRDSPQLRALEVEGVPLFR